MMDMKSRSLILAFLICATPMTAVSAEEISLDPVTVNLGLGNLEDYAIDEGDAIETKHCERPKFDYSVYPVSIESDAGRIELEVHVLDEPVEMTAWVLEHSLITAGLSSLTEELEGSGESFTMDGHDAIMMTTNDGEKTVYGAVYSPDEVDGWGILLFLISSDLPLDVTETIFESVEVDE
jgi:hypothetical protein